MTHLSLRHALLRISLLLRLLCSITQLFSNWLYFLPFRSFSSLFNFQGAILKPALRPLVGTSGLEPPTSRLSGARSNHLSYAPMSGGDEEVRTPDPLRARQVLSQLSYTPKF